MRDMELGPEQSAQQASVAGVVLAATSAEQAQYERLQRLFCDVAGSSSVHTYEDTVALIDGGGGLDAILAAKQAIFGPSDQDKATAQVRTEYLRVVMRKPLIRGRKARAQLSYALEQQYIDSVVTNIENVLDANTAEEALTVGHLPRLVQGASFDEAAEEPLTIDDLAGHHLHVLVHTALGEHISRREHIDQYRQRSRIAKVLGSRTMRMMVAGGIFAASLTPKLGVLPASADILGEDIDIGLKLTSAAIICLEAPEALRLKYLAHKHDKDTHELHNRLASGHRLSRLALLIAHSTPRYTAGLAGSSSLLGKGETIDKNDSLRQFQQLHVGLTRPNHDTTTGFDRGALALGYAARLLIQPEKRKQLHAIVTQEKSPEDRRELFLQLSREILKEDLTRMRKGLYAVHLHKLIKRAVVMVPPALFSSYLSVVEEARTLSSRATEVFAARRSRAEEN